MMVVSLILSFVFAGHTEGFYSDVKNTKLHRAWNAVVKVEHQVRGRVNSSRTRYNFKGSGVIIHKLNERIAYVLTNAHVVTCKRYARCKTKITLSTSEGKQVSSEVELIYYEAERDIALIKVYADFRGIEAIKSAKKPEKTFAKVFAIGYPEISVRKRWQVQASHYRKEHKYISSGHITGEMKDVSHQDYQFLDGSIHDFYIENLYIHSADTLPGNSGGALVDQEGRLLAINTGINFIKNSNLKGYPYCYKDGASGKKHLGCFYIALPTFAISDVLARARQK